MNLPDADFKLLILVGISVMLLLFVSFLLIFISTQRRRFRYQRHLQQLREKQQELLIKAAVRSEESERLRIAEELHDEMGALLFSAKLHFQSVRASENDLPLQQKGQELLDEAIRRIRGLSHNLHSSILQEFGLLEAIRNFVSKLTDDNLIQATTALDCECAAVFRDNEISIYRMIQELINNTLKHAHARRIHVSCVNTAEKFVLTIFHDGEGLTQERFDELKFRPGSMGFKIIQNRLILLKGELLFTQRPNGYYIDLFLPVA
ncbi:MAG TPA: ATP-binding protein [Puia sp.]|nr:ATP-binding protein [Puia sp.]